ncbi:MAG TPA: efflux RND transporter permease subunit [Parafilimonas sp.]|nr:efflux RND transporter permease subunit [Parafilimonas sp.]
MNLLRGALRKPVTIIVAMMAILFFSVMAIRNMKIDIFPKLGLPTVYVAQPYGGLSPEQMEGFIASYYEYHFLYITGVKYVESKSIQGATICKIQFNEGTDMAQAMAEVVGYVNRARAFMPPGTVPPFITRFDAGSVPVGQLVFTSNTRSLGEIQDLALFRVRPMFATLPGVSAPPPFGGNQKTVIIKADPNKLRDYNLSPDQLVQAIAKSNTITPAGNISINNQTFLTPQNTIVENIKELENVPVINGQGPNVYVHDVATVQIGSDITTSYALVNGKRSIYIPVTKRADASTWDVVQNVKKALPDMQAAVPNDIKVSYEFDQSGYVINSVKSLLLEGGLGAILTGIMVLLFLRDLRSALIVVITIPLALLTGTIFLYLFGQTINIMTLGGLALSVGILVDQATVTIENIHQHLERGERKAHAILNACREITIPLLLILFSILAVFAPSLFMSGVPKGMFLPLALSVGFSMIASFFLALTVVPVLTNWILKERQKNNNHHQTKFENFKESVVRKVAWLSKKTLLTVIVYFLISLALVYVLFTFIGTDIFPTVDAAQAQVRLRLPAGTRLERTEDATQKLLHIADNVSNHQVEITSAFVGTQPSSYPINDIYLWSSGPQEALIKINLKTGAMPIEKFREVLRDIVPKEIPGATVSFEPGDLVNQVLNLGANNPIELAVTGRNFNQTRVIAEKLKSSLQSIAYLRDVQIATPLDYPAIKINIDRVKAGQLGLTVDQISKSTVAATTSSRFTQPNYWLDKSTGTAYQVQVEFPQYSMNTPEQIEAVPLSQNANQQLYLRDIATWQKTTMPGEYDRYNQQRYIPVTANIHEKDLQQAVNDVNKAIKNLGTLPTGIKIMVRGQADLLTQTTSELQSGLLIAIVVIFMMLTINFQSFKLSLITLSIIPGVMAGSILLLLATGSTLNIQSYMGMIMAVGVAVANAILFITNAEQHRKLNESNAHLSAVRNRMRPILMTSLAMIAGMLPMALGLGETGDQTAPLARAVIGGLLFSMISTIVFLPLIYQSWVGKIKYKNVSLDPEDEQSSLYEK